MSRQPYHLESVRPLPPNFHLPDEAINILAWVAKFLNEVDSCMSGASKRRELRAWHQRQRFWGMREWC